ncbi:hypothetical protein DNFV4_00635 [Nitrospira tepida]|uniref:Uncharacterized protein n=2 Tax=Nitrospira tepida TaxID=2973512 RepID=A0AA86MWA7_9BACT|nr:hypothetical protein DNFV4_00635 [Nitrospira tepida]
MRQVTVIGVIGLTGAVLAAGLLVTPAGAEEKEEPKIRQLRCGSCPEGFATTAVTSDPKTCPEGDATLVQCVPLGGNLLSVCGECPEGYVKVGGTMVPTQCARDGGAMSRCQLQKMDSSTPNPSQGGRFCPPDCAGQFPTPGQGAMPPPGQTLPPPPSTGQGSQ